MWSKTSISLRLKKKTKKNPHYFSTALQLMKMLQFLRLCEKQLSAGILMRLPYQQRPAQPIFISALLATSCLDAINNDMLDIIIVWNNE